MGQRMVLGTTDYGWNLKPFAEACVPGSILVLRGAGCERTVHFEVLLGRGLRVSFTGTDPGRDALRRLADQLDLLGVSHREGPGYLDLASDAHGLAARRDYSRLADLALKACGFEPGDGFTQEWQGAIDKGRDSEHLLALYREASSAAGEGWVRAFLEWVRSRL